MTSFPRALLPLCFLLACGPAPSQPGPEDAGPDASVGPGQDADAGSSDGVVETRWPTTAGTQLLDWGSGRQLDPALVAAGGAEVHYCQQHFPPGSQVLANLKAAVTAYGALPGVSLRLAVVPEPGTSSHPDLTTFTLPPHAVYVDSQTLPPGAWASTSFGACTLTSASAPQSCSRARIFVSADRYLTDLQPTLRDEAPSVGVFLHEVGHVFGQGHLNPDDGSVLLDPDNLGFDRTTIHGPKFHASDPRGITIQAASLAFLRHWYGEASPGLEIDELVVHPVTVRADVVTRTTLEFSTDKDFVYGGGAPSLIEALNEVKLRWGPGGFETCSASGPARWLARHSELSSRAVDAPYSIAFDVSTASNPTPDQWTRVATARGLHTWEPGEPAVFRQVEWQVVLGLSAAATGLPASGPTAVTTRRLAFGVDPDRVVQERREGDDRWEVTLCLYPARESGSSAVNDCSEPCP